ncbi:hypothetical protein AI27_02190 [Sphingomonas sp. BHC-A]|nr:hypothetical protein AI27_02190 [Sphingomonas sp. BHC-A]
MRAGGGTISRRRRCLFGPGGKAADPCPTQPVLQHDGNGHVARLRNGAGRRATGCFESLSYRKRK